MRRFLQEKGWIIALIAAILFALIPVGARIIAGNPAIAASESYYNLRISHEVLQDPILEFDLLQQRPYNFNLYHYFLAPFMIFIPDQGLIALSLLLALSSGYMIYKTLKNLGLSEEKTVFGMLAFFLSPIYGYIATTLTEHSLTLFLLSLSAYLYTRRDDYWNLLPASLTVLTDPAAFLTFWFILVAYKYQSRQSYRDTSLLLAGATMIFLFFYNTFGYVPVFKFEGGLSPNNFITDFGAVFGYPFFTLLLAVVVIFLFWRTDIRAKINHLAFLAVLIFSTTLAGSRLVVNLAIALYAGFGLDRFLQREWNIISLKDLTLLLLISSLLFSAVSYNTRLANMQPTQDTVRSLQAIKVEDRPGMVLSKPENGFMIEYYTNKRAYLDGLSFLYTDSYAKRTISEEIFRLSAPTETKKILDSNDITYFYIDEEMQRRMWDGEEGLLLVLEVSESFIKLAEFQGKESWLYIRI